MLQAIQENMDSGRSIYGMNRGTIGFLMNEYREEDLHERIIAADNPDWKPGLGTTPSPYLSDRQSDRTPDRPMDRRN